MMARVFGSLSETFSLITEHSNKHLDVPEESIRVADHQLWHRCFRYAHWNTRYNRPLVDVPERSSESIRTIRQEYLTLADGRRLVIKNPSHILYPDLIREIFPDAVFVFCARNPWTTLQSMVAKGRTSFLLRSSRTQEPGLSLLLKAAVGWADAMDNYVRHRDRRWTVAAYEKIVADPRTRLSELFRQLHIDDDPGLEASYGIPCVTKQKDYYFIKQAFRRSPTRTRLMNELRQGCELFGYPLSPDDLPGSFRGHVLQRVSEKIRRLAG